MQTLLTPDIVGPRLSGRKLGCNIHHFLETDSTMNEAARLAAEGAPHGTLVLAEEQSAGRGRHGNSWVSESSVCLYFTLLMRPDLSPSQAPIMTLMTGVAVAEAIHNVTAISVDIRWPNDILCGEKKCAGILVEMSAHHDRIDHVLVGVGINVNHQKVPEGLRTEATSLRIEAGHEIQRVDVLAAVLERMEHHWERLIVHGQSAIVERFVVLSSYASGKRVMVVDSENGLKGVTAGLTPDGMLLVARDDGSVERVLSGHVRPDL